MALMINSQCIKINGYSPADILLGLNPVAMRSPGINLSKWSKHILLGSGDILETSEISITSHVDTREEKGINGVEELARNQHRLHPQKTAGYPIPKAGDLVLLRDFQLYKDGG